MRWQYNIIDNSVLVIIIVNGNNSFPPQKLQSGEEKTQTGALVIPCQPKRLTLESSTTS